MIRISAPVKAFVPRGESDTLTATIRKGGAMTVTAHSVPTPLLTPTEIEPWRAVPVAIAADLVPDQQIDPLIRPINPPGQQPRLFGRAVTAQCESPDFGAVLHALEHA